MKLFFIVILLSFFQCSLACADVDVLVIQSMPIKPYDEALQGCKSVIKTKLQKIISSDLSKTDIISKVKRIKPKLILAIGMDALAKVKGTSNVPIVYLMVLNPHALVTEDSNITGVSLSISPERQLSQLRQILPQARKIGIVYDPLNSGVFVAKAHNSAIQMGIELVTEEVHSSRAAIEAVNMMKGKVNLLWMLPDISVVNPATIDLLLLSTIENRIPVLSFSDKYVEKGALMSLEVDPVEAGRQAGEIAARILAGVDVHDIKEQDAHGSILTVNLIVAKKLGITINENALKQARVIR